MALLRSFNRSLRGPEAGQKSGVRVSRWLPAPPPTDAALAPVGALLSCQSAGASRSSVLQERGRSLLLPSAFRLEPIRGLQAQRARRRAPSLGTVTTRPLRSSSGADPQRITDATTPTNSAVDLGVWFPTIPPLVLYHDLRLHVDQDFRRDGGTRAGRLERVLGTTAALGCDHLYLCPSKMNICPLRYGTIKLLHDDAFNDFIVVAMNLRTFSAIPPD
ncbi:uncharacterized protein LOC144155349 [Haemaphysalis longicornis]